MASTYICSHSESFHKFCTKVDFERFFLQEEKYWSILIWWWRGYRRRFFGEKTACHKACGFRLCNPCLWRSPSSSVLFSLVDDLENVPLHISDEDIGNLDNPPLSPTERLFTYGFEGEEGLEPVSEELPLASLLVLSVTHVVNPPCFFTCSSPNDSPHCCPSCRS